MTFIIFIMALALGCQAPSLIAMKKKHKQEAKTLFKMLEKKAKKQKKRKKEIYLDDDNLAESTGYFNIAKKHFTIWARTEQKNSDDTCTMSQWYWSEKHKNYVLIAHTIEKWLPDSNKQEFHKDNKDAPIGILAIMDKDTNYPHAVIPFSFLESGHGRWGTNPKPVTIKLSKSESLYPDLQG